MIREKGGAAVKLSQSNWVGRALATYLPTQVICILTMTVTIKLMMVLMTMVMRKRMIVKTGIEDNDNDPS